MVIIAVLAILAALLLPALARAKASARFTECKSNVKQISLAIAMYVGDNGSYPVVVATDFQFPMWLAAIAPNLSLDASRQFYVGGQSYNKYSKLLVCPGDTLLPGMAGELPDMSYGYNTYGMSTFAGWNLPWADIGLAQLGLGGNRGRAAQSSGLIWPPRSQDIVVPLHDSDVVVPAEMIESGDAFAESYRVIYRGGGELIFNGADDLGVPGSPFNWDLRKLASARHGSRANVAFCDGHVEGARFNDLFAETDPAFQRWNSDHLPHRNLRIR